MSISLAPIHIPAIRPGFDAADATTPVKRHTHPWPYENEFNQYHHTPYAYGGLSIDRERKMFYGYPETQFQVSVATRPTRIERHSKQHNNVNITHYTRNPSPLSLSLPIACLLAQLSWSASQRSSGGLHERHRRAPSISQCGGSGATVCRGHLSVQLRYAHLLLARWAPRLPRGLLEHR